MKKRNRVAAFLLAASMALSSAPVGFNVASAADAVDSGFETVLSSEEHGQSRYLLIGDEAGNPASNAFNVVAYNSTFSGTFGDQHQCAIELYMHGNRIATNGDVHYRRIPEQWDATPAPAIVSDEDRVTQKVFDEDTNTITVPMTFDGDGAESEELNYSYELITTPVESGVKISVVLKEDLPSDLKGVARFNLEFIPSKYRNKSYQVASQAGGNFDTYGVFPMHPQDPMEDIEWPEFDQAWYVDDWNEERGPSQPEPFATGHAFSLAPEDEFNNIVITSESGELEMYDGRNRAQNGWYVLSDVLDGSTQAGDTVVEWIINPTVKEDWVRDPMVAFSQVGYAPQQDKVAVIELDMYDNGYAEDISLLKVNADGSEEEVYAGKLTAPEIWRRYKHAKFDFSDVKETGMYRIAYAGQKTEVFPIANDVYNESWQSALSNFLAVQMDHIEVRDGYRLWHGASHMDDASIPNFWGKSGEGNYAWFDGMNMPNEDNKPEELLRRIEAGLLPEFGEHIEGLNVGGWFDAGDFDIQTARNIQVLEDLIQAYSAFEDEELGKYDTLSVEWDAETGGIVEMHRPDGIPDLIQQINHGMKQIEAQYRILGGTAGAMELRTLRQYTHLGDPSSDTDGYIYDPDLAPSDVVERDGKVYSGRPDDRVMMLGGGGGNYTANLLGTTSADFAGAAYALREAYPEDAAVYLEAALRIWNAEAPLPAALPDDSVDEKTAGNRGAIDEGADGVPDVLLLHGSKEWATLVQLIKVLSYLENSEEQPALKINTDLLVDGLSDLESLKQRLVRYANLTFKDNVLTADVDETSAAMESNWGFVLALADMEGVVPEAPYRSYEDVVSTSALLYAAQVEKELENNPAFGVPFFNATGWGISPNVISIGQRTGILYKFFPECESFKEYTLNAVNFVFGTHPQHNHSWLSGLGTKSHLLPYNSNRADESFIPGSILPGYVTPAPDFVESMDDFTFLWFENESIINYQSQWVSAGMAASMIANEGGDESANAIADFENDFMMTAKKTGEDDYGDVGYLETPGFNLFMYNGQFDNTFGDQHSAGIELIQSGRRIGTNGDIHLLPTPEQWDATPAPSIKERVIDEEADIASVSLTFPGVEGSEEKAAVDYTMTAEPEAGGVKLTIKLEEELPADLVGKAGFNLEFIPSQFVGKSIQTADAVDGNYNDFRIFPLVPEDEMEQKDRARTEDQSWYVKDWNDARGNYQPTLIASGEKMIFAAEDAENRIRITSEDGLELFDGRNRAQNGWFVLRSVFEAGQTEIVWHISPDVAEDWTREPNVAYNQAGYEPNRDKVAVVELDPAYDAPETATIERLDEHGTYTAVQTVTVGAPKTWLRYEYRNIDFSTITTPGMYRIVYGDVKTGLFPIKEGAYANSWQATLGVYFPVQMDHMTVREAYRIWHQESHMDDAIQAPFDTQWFDGWSMGPEDTATTPFEPLERIVGQNGETLNVGGWYDAGDFDIQTSRNMGVIQDLALAFDEFGVDLDTTLVDFENRFVEAHRPDGVSDIKQQVKQGILQIIAQLETVGFVFPVLEVSSLRQYTHLGDGSKDTDNLMYDATLAPDEVRGLKSGLMDDRMALAHSKDIGMQLNAIATLASASYVLKGYDDVLANKCLDMAKELWNEEMAAGSIITEGDPSDRAVRNQLNNGWNAAIQLLLATDGVGDEYIALINDMADIQIDVNSTRVNFGAEGWKAVRILNYLDTDFEDAFKATLEEYVPALDAQVASNPFGVPDTNGMWGGSTGVVDMGVRMSILNKYYPELVSTDYIFRVMDYILGTHPYNNTSWLSGVGTDSINEAYGSNRADKSYIAGGIVPGYVNIQPDFPEALDDFNFLWFESEYVIDTAAKWIVLANAANAADTAR